MIGADVGTILTIDGVISGAFTSNLLTNATATSTVILAGSDTYEGYTEVRDGYLAIDNASALGGAPLNGGRGTSIYSGATLQVEGGFTFDIEPLTLNGSGVNGTAGALESLNGSNTWQGPMVLGSAAMITAAAGSTFTDHIQIANEGYLLTVGGAGNVNLSTTISGSGGLTKDGTGTLTFGGPVPNLYVGQTTINGGTLFLSKSPLVLAITGAVVINAGGTLAGTGTIEGNVTNSGIVMPGGQGVVGTLSIEGNYTQTAGGVLDLEIASAKSFDQLMVAGVATVDGTVNVILLDGFEPTNGDKFPILTFSSSVGKFTEINLPSLTAGCVLTALYDPKDLTIAAEESAPLA